MPNTPPYRLLLVEPNESTAAPIRALLQQNGFHVDVVASPVEARERDIASYALIIVDVHRGDREGMLFVQWLHRQHSHLVGKVVVISADDGGALAEELAALEVCDVVAKPIDAEAILRAVFDCLEPQSNVH